jgi:hypothetical protein
VTDLLARLKGVEPSGDGWTARCPAHEDRHNSLSVHHRDGRWLVKCHAGCNWRAITDALGMDAADLFDDEERGGGRFHPSDNRATAQPTAGASASQIPGLTLDRYATLKMLPIDFLKLAEAAEKHWRRLDGHNQLPKVILGVKFTDGIEVVRSQAQAAAA